MLTDFIAPLFYRLLYMSVTALAAGLVILLLRRLADKRFSPVWKYAMWLVVVAALVLPWRPQSSLALLRDTEPLQAVSFRADYSSAQAEYYLVRETENPTPEQTAEIAKAQSKADSLHWKTLLFDSVLPLLWLGGTVLLGLLLLASRLRLGRKIRGTRSRDTAHYDVLLAQCRQELGIRRRVEILLQSHVKTPALLGFLRPKILLPQSIESMSDAQLSYVLLHELSHLKRGDSLVNALLLALQTVYWFNPLTWLLFKFLLEDMELANDAAVLKGKGAAERKEYSLSLVAVLAGGGKTTFAPRLLCMADSEKNISRRIDMIQLGGFFKRRKWLIAIAGVLVIALTATLFLTATATQNHKIEVTDELIQAVDRITQAHYQSTGDKVDFAVTASKIHAAYRQGDTVRIFATTVFSCYEQRSGVLWESGAGAVPIAIDCKETAPGDYVLLTFTEAQDGNRFAPSIEDFCRLPAGQKIKGLAAEIQRDYGDTAALEDAKQQKTVDYVTANGLTQIVQNNAPFLHAPEAVLQALWQNKTPYIGDNSKVSALVNALATWSAPQSAAAARGFNLETGERPYGLGVRYRDDEASAETVMQRMSPRELQFRALIFLCLIDNADFVRYDFYEAADMKTPEHTLEYTKEWADKTVGGDVRAFAKDFESFQGFVNEIYSKYLPLSVGFESRPKPAVQVTIEENYGGADTAFETIYEDAHYKYALSSIRSEKVMLLFEDEDSPLFGQRITLKESIEKKYITIEDLILNGLQVSIEPKNLPQGSALAGGSFNYHPLGEWYMNEYLFFPSNHFMYMVTMPGSDELKAYFALDELIDHMERILKSDFDAEVPADRLVMIEGLAYIREDALALLKLSVEVLWGISRACAPAYFRYAG